MIKLKNLRKEKNIVVFPGVEISASGGEAGIHVIGILDVDKGSKEITALLGNLIDPVNFGKQQDNFLRDLWEQHNS